LLNNVVINKELIYLSIIARRRSLVNIASISRRFCRVSSLLCLCLN